MLQSTDDHFRLAGEKGMRSALAQAGTRLLEPWWSVEVVVPQDHLGELIHDISSHRGRIVGMEVEGDTARLMAHAPYRELRTFSGRLQALTGGRGAFKATPNHYEPLPEHLVGEAIQESPFRATRAHGDTPVPAGPRQAQREQ
jgi:elongation factor G